MSNLPKLLLVDDDPVALHLLNHSLRGMGQLFFATHGNEALQHLHQRPFDLVLLDAIMPEMDGFATCQAIRNLNPFLPVLFVTGANDPESEVRALESGAVDFITKPIHPAIVRARVAAQLRLQAQHQEIQQANARLLTVTAERSRLEERQHLIQDMHDGFGSQLASARLRLRSGQLSVDALDTLLKECLDDLYLVMDAISSSADTLQEQLVQYRHRLNRRMGDLPPRISWRMDLEQAPPMERRKGLQILRILQEAIQNALKHAQAEQLQIHILHDHTEGWRLRITDDGIGLPAVSTGGQGLTNMRQRAQRMGAQLIIQAAHPGTPRPGTEIQLRISPEPVMEKATPAPRDLKKI
jgi:DNA-binding response OmpR family regulator